MKRWLWWCYTILDLCKVKKRNYEREREYWWRLFYRWGKRLVAYPISSSVMNKVSSCSLLSTESFNFYFIHMIEFKKMVFSGHNAISKFTGNIWFSLLTSFIGGFGFISNLLKFLWMSSRDFQVNVDEFFNFSTEGFYCLDWVNKFL